MDTNDIAALQEITATLDAAVEQAKGLISNTADSGVTELANCVITNASLQLEELNEVLGDEDNDVDFNDEDEVEVETPAEDATDTTEKLWKGAILS